MDDQNEQNRITLSIAFIATYLTIIIGFLERIKMPTTELNFINDLAFGIFVGFGILISLLFFLYLVFTALELNFYEKKEVMFDQEVSKEKLNSIRKALFNWGVRSIFVSFSFPVYYLMSGFMASYSFRIAMLLWAFCLMLVYILLHIIFRDKNKN